MGQSCSSGKINGIFHTSCYPWQSGDGTLNVVSQPGGSTVSKNNDRPRLQRALNDALGRIVFDEADYFINDELIVYSYRTIVGTGRSSYLGTINTSNPLHPSSKIVQITNNKAVFKIGTAVQDVSIRDLALVAGYDTTGTIGILAEGSGGGGNASLFFQFSNLKFSNFSKGIYVKATDNEWQFDNIRLDHSMFEWCDTAVHINSYNSGWSVTSIDLLVPEDGYGFYLERSTYSSFDLIIGNGPFSENYATALFYVKDHGNLSIRNTVSERFDLDINIDGNSITGTGRNFPILLQNNHFMNGIEIKDSTVVSVANQFGFGEGNVSALAKGTAQIYSLGDKFCFEGVSCETDKTYTVQDDAVLLFGSNKYKTEVDTLRIGTRTFANLGTPANGTMYYCSNCQQASTCSSGGSGAFAKRINGSWSCN